MANLIVRPDTNCHTFQEAQVIRKNVSTFSFKLLVEFLTAMFRIPSRFPGYFNRSSDFLQNLRGTNPKWRASRIYLQKQVELMSK